MTTNSGALAPLFVNGGRVFTIISELCAEK